LSELYDDWSRVLAEAERRAREAGRGDVVDYLSLRASNDLIRQTAAAWLFTTFTTLAGEANRAGAGVSTGQQDGHRFAVGSSTMVGQLLTLRSGVRALMVEAGWPRAPGDGIVRGAGLACGRIRHLGAKSADRDLLLVRAHSSGVPQWLVVGDKGDRKPLLESAARAHLTRLLTS
jgi:hypothetical protein